MTIKEIRELSGLSVGEFSALYNIGGGTIRSWERGDRIPPAYVTDLLTRVVKEDLIRGIDLRELAEMKRRTDYDE